MTSVDTYCEKSPFCNPESTYTTKQIARITFMNKTNAVWQQWLESAHSIWKSLLIIIFLLYINVFCKQQEYIVNKCRHW